MLCHYVAYARSCISSVNNAPTSSGWNIGMVYQSSDVSYKELQVLNFLNEQVLGWPADSDK
jgi:hypothetical protein